jgi:hypothetical protein
MTAEASPPNGAPDPRRYPRTIKGMYQYARDRGLDHDQAGIAAIKFHEKFGLTFGQKAWRFAKNFGRVTIAIVLFVLIMATVAFLWGLAKPTILEYVDPKVVLCLGWGFMIGWVVADRVCRRRHGHGL